MTKHLKTTPKLTLEGIDGNAHFIMSAALKAARQAGEAEEALSSLRVDMKSGDYDHLLQVVLANFDVS